MLELCECQSWRLLKSFWHVAYDSCSTWWVEFIFTVKRHAAAHLLLLFWEPSMAQKHCFSSQNWAANDEKKSSKHADNHMNGFHSPSRQQNMCDMQKTLKHSRKTSWAKLGPALGAWQTSVNWPILGEPHQYRCNSSIRRVSAGYKCTNYAI